MALFIEVWADIPEYEGLYQASNLGNIKSLDRIIELYNGGRYKRKGKLLRPIKNHQGYMQIHLLKNGKVKTLLVHRIIAKTFIKNPNKYCEVNHKNEVKNDNRVENLEWCTQEYNKRYGTAIQRRTKKISKRVNQYDLSGNFIKTWDSMREIERKTNIHNQQISLCCLGKRKKAGGFIWRYYEQKRDK